MKKAILLTIPIIFTAQACNLFGSPGASGERGVFYSLDSGSTWQAGEGAGQAGNFSSAAVNEVVLEQRNPENLMAAAVGRGIYGSDDGGESWIELVPDFSGYAVTFSPADADELFAGGAKNRKAAILKSEDRAQTWTQVFDEPEIVAAVSTLTVNSANSDVLYAGLTTGTILRSADRGNTWNRIHEISSDRIEEVAAGRRGANQVYALARSSGLLQSADSGVSWRELDVGSGISEYYDLEILPSAPEILLVASSDGLYRSGDAGLSWQRLRLPITEQANRVTAAAINPQNTIQIFAAIRTTVYRSDDNGQTWQVKSLPTNRTIVDLKVHPGKPNVIYAGLQ